MLSRYPKRMVQTRKGGPAGVGGEECMKQIHLWRLQLVITLATELPELADKLHLMS